VSADPWTPEWLEEKGIDEARWAERGCWRYERGDPRVVEAFRPFLRPSKLATVTKVVNQSAGWVMVKHAPPRFPPIPPQLRPDIPVIVDGRTIWHYHGPDTGERPVFPPEAGELAGKPLPMKRKEADGKWVYTGCLLWGAVAEAHVWSKPNDGEGDYDIVTGEGRHNGVPVDVVHRHAPQAAKYVLLTNREDDDPRAKREASRIDLPPLARQLLGDAKVVFMALEGTPKTDAVLSAGYPVFGVPSVTCCDPRELRDFAWRFLKERTVLIVPDADWATNWQVERQALKIRTLHHRLGIDAHVCAPPTEDETDDYHKGVDDFLGAGYELGELTIAGREVPFLEIFGAVQGIHPYHRQASVKRALEDLSLYVNREDGKLCKKGEWTGSFQALKGLLGIRDSDRVVRLLEDIGHCFTVVSGSIEREVKKTRYGRRHEETVFTNRPTISLNEEFRAHQRRERLLAKDFWQRRAFESHDQRLDELERWRAEQENPQAAA
jgi:hypothetical protein